MRKLNLDECVQAAGGTQYFVSTDKLVINGFPESCLESYYNANKNNFSAFTDDDDLINRLISFCIPEGTTDYSVDVEFVTVSVGLIEV